MRSRSISGSGRVLCDEGWERSRDGALVEGSGGVAVAIAWLRRWCFADRRRYVFNSYRQKISTKSH